MQPYRRQLKYPARRLRTAMTAAEQALWFRLRRKQVLGVQFYRQKPLLDFIVDFYAPAAGLVIEVDGSQHCDKGRVLADRARDAALAGRGLRVLRFDNRQVLVETDSVMLVIWQIVAERLCGGER
ncbi:MULTISPECIES: endonuclease domain-containing protein [unclassified Lysobacter]|uniref:endonuclease domain-containing protein n=1 Tax=unclassified Lysobacter TaxID=2635362 RepID=UPI0006F8B799|nr:MULTISPECIES: endonuclease domain-containing protein [unclassified Lysobacter]KQZ56855.1 hypothetical protein ASD53_10165 [Lysobacter sp. Root559]KRC34699.1 hypothetical protein ASE10_08320 [Lysobacter sp. Root76]KRD70387.1 hypothetical protein ASE45_00485 [Lysobacter sp. Root96]